MGGSSICNAPARWSLRLPIQGTCSGAPPNLQFRPELSFDKLQRQGDDSDGVVERSRVDCPRVLALTAACLLARLLANHRYRGKRYRHLLLRVRVHPLVHAPSKITPFGKILALQTPERTPSSAPQVHAQELQRRSPSG